VDAGDLADREAALAQAISDADELLKTFNAVLSLSRLQTGERRRAFETLDLAAIIADVAELYEPVCEETGHEFAVDAADGLTILGDRELVAQATANLVDNAIKYTPEGGAIMLRVRSTSSGAVELSVTDTGPGIAPEERPRVLERFVRLEASRNLPGVGLGLSLVQALPKCMAQNYLWTMDPERPMAMEPGCASPCCFRAIALDTLAIRAASGPVCSP